MTRQSGSACCSIPEVLAVVAAPCFAAFKQSLQCKPWACVTGEHGCCGLGCRTIYSSHIPGAGAQQDHPGAAGRVDVPGGRDQRTPGRRHGAGGVGHGGLRRLHLAVRPLTFLQRCYIMSLLNCAGGCRFMKRCALQKQQHVHELEFRISYNIVISGSIRGSCPHNGPCSLSHARHRVCLSQL